MWTHKNIPELTIVGEIWGIFSDFFGEKTPQDIKSTLHFQENLLCH